MDKRVLAAKAAGEIMELSPAEREELINLCQVDGLNVADLVQALGCLSEAKQSRG